MFTIKTHIKESPINGIGVFALEPIDKGQVIWYFQKNIDIMLSDDSYNELPNDAKTLISHFGYYNSKEGGWCLCGDNARYTNHSTTPNMQACNDTKVLVSIAVKDISVGDEITEDYYYFDEKAEEKLKYKT